MISAGYRALNAQYARANPSWATGGARHRDTVLKLIAAFGCATVLDYGCGRGALGNAVMGRDGHHKPAAVLWYDYDPAIPGRDLYPASADLVVCTHVLEHVEPELLDGTLEELRRIARQVLYLAVPSKPARAVLPDGRNAHLTQQPPEWWLAKFRALGPAMAVLTPTRPDETRVVITCA